MVLHQTATTTDTIGSVKSVGFGGKEGGGCGYGSVWMGWFLSIYMMDVNIILNLLFIIFSLAFVSNLMKG